MSVEINLLDNGMGGDKKQDLEEAREGVKKGRSVDAEKRAENPLERLISYLNNPEKLEEFLNSPEGQEAQKMIEDAERTAAEIGEQMQGPLGDLASELTQLDPRRFLEGKKAWLSPDIEAAFIARLEQIGFDKDEAKEVWKGILDSHQQYLEHLMLRQEEEEQRGLLKRAYHRVVKPFGKAGVAGAGMWATSKLALIGVAAFGLSGWLMTAAGVAGAGVGYGAYAVLNRFFPSAGKWIGRKMQKWQWAQKLGVGKLMKTADKEQRLFKKAAESISPDDLQRMIAAYVSVELQNRKNLELLEKGKEDDKREKQKYERRKEDFIKQSFTVGLVTEDDLVSIGANRGKAWDFLEKKSEGKKKGKGRNNVKKNVMIGVGRISAQDLKEMGVNMESAKKRVKENPSCKKVYEEILSKDEVYQNAKEGSRKEKEAEEQAVVRALLLGKKIEKLEQEWNRLYAQIKKMARKHQDAYLYSVLLEGKDIDNIESKELESLEKESAVEAALFISREMNTLAGELKALDWIAEEIQKGGGTVERSLARLMNHPMYKLFARSSLYGADRDIGLKGYKNEFLFASIGGALANGLGQMGMGDIRFGATYAVSHIAKMTRMHHDISQYELEEKEIIKTSDEVLKEAEGLLEKVKEGQASEEEVKQSLADLRGWMRACPFMAFPRARIERVVRQIQDEWAYRKATEAVQKETDNFMEKAANSIDASVKEMVMKGVVEGEAKKEQVRRSVQRLYGVGKREWWKKFAINTAEGVAGFVGATWGGQAAEDIGGAAARGAEAGQYMEHLGIQKEAREVVLQGGVSPEEYAVLRSLAYQGAYEGMAELSAEEQVLTIEQELFRIEQGSVIPPRGEGWDDGEMQERMQAFVDRHQEAIEKLPEDIQKLFSFEEIRNAEHSGQEEVFQKNIQALLTMERLGLFSVSSSSGDLGKIFHLFAEKESPLSSKHIEIRAELLLEGNPSQALKMLTLCADIRESGDKNANQALENVLNGGGSLKGALDTSFYSLISKEEGVNLQRIAGGEGSSPEQKIPDTLDGYHGKISDDILQEVNRIVGDGDGRVPEREAAQMLGALDSAGLTRGVHPETVSAIIAAAYGNHWLESDEAKQVLVRLFQNAFGEVSVGKETEEVAEGMRKILENYNASNPQELGDLVGQMAENRSIVFFPMEIGKEFAMEAGEHSTEGKEDAKRILTSLAGSGADEIYDSLFSNFDITKDDIKILTFMQERGLTAEHLGGSEAFRDVFSFLDRPEVKYVAEPLVDKITGQQDGAKILVSLAEHTKDISLLSEGQIRYVNEIVEKQGPITEGDIKNIKDVPAFYHPAQIVISAESEGDRSGDNGREAMRRTSATNAVSFLGSEGFSAEQGQNGTIRISLEEGQHLDQALRRLVAQYADAEYVSDVDENGNRRVTVQDRAVLEAAVANVRNALLKGEIEGARFDKQAGELTFDSAKIQQVINEEAARLSQKITDANLSKFGAAAAVNNTAHEVWEQIFEKRFAQEAGEGKLTVENADNNPDVKQAEQNAFAHLAKEGFGFPEGADIGDITAQDERSGTFEVNGVEVAIEDGVVVSVGGEKTHIDVFDDWTGEVRESAQKEVREWVAVGQVELAAQKQAMESLQKGEDFSEAELEKRGEDGFQMRAVADLVSALQEGLEGKPPNDIQRLFQQAVSASKITEDHIPVFLKVVSRDGMFDASDLERFKDAVQGKDGKEAHQALIQKIEDEYVSLFATGFNKESVPKEREGYQVRYVYPPTKDGDVKPAVIVAMRQLHDSSVAVFGLPSGLAVNGERDPKDPQVIIVDKTEANHLLKGDWDDEYLHQIQHLFQRFEGEKGAGGSSGGSEERAGEPSVDSEEKGAEQEGKPPVQSASEPSAEREKDEVEEEETGEITEEENTEQEESGKEGMEAAGSENANSAAERLRESHRLLEQGNIVQGIGSLVADMSQGREVRIQLSGEGWTAERLGASGEEAGSADAISGPQLEEIAGAVERSLGLPEGWRMASIIYSDTGAEIRGSNSHGDQFFITLHDGQEQKIKHALEEGIRAADNMRAKAGDGKYSLTIFEEGVAARKEDNLRTLAREQYQDSSAIQNIIQWIKGESAEEKDENKRVERSHRDVVMEQPEAHNKEHPFSLDEMRQIVGNSAPSLDKFFELPEGFDQNRPVSTGTIRVVDFDAGIVTERGDSTEIMNKGELNFAGSERVPQSELAALAWDLQNRIRDIINQDSEVKRIAFRPSTSVAGIEFETPEGDRGVLPIGEQHRQTGEYREQALAEMFQGIQDVRQDLVNKGIENVVFQVTPLEARAWQNDPHTGEKKLLGEVRLGSVLSSPQEVTRAMAELREKIERNTALSQAA